MDSAAWQLLVLELALVAFLALLSASEAALNSVRRPEIIEQLAARGRSGRRAETMGRHGSHYLAAIQVSEFLVVFAYAGIAAAFIAPRLSQLIAFFVGIDTTAIFTDVGAVVVTVAVLSLIAILFGLFVPRAIAARHAQSWLLVLVWPLQLITTLTRPLVTVLFFLTQTIARPFGGSPTLGGEVTEEEIRALVETGQAQGILERKEQEMISSIFELGEKTVQEVMVPRTDIVGLDVQTTPDELVERITTVGHSRIPVYDGSADDIAGILYVKDVFRRIARGERNFDLRQFLRPAVFVPETKKVDALLREMQRNKVHIAIVVDEYGGTAGLVTIEDLVEEIVGEIRDEYDVEHELVLPVSESEALMDARVPFEEVRETFALEVEPTEAYDTLGGFITAHLGRFPRQGESFEAAGARFVIEGVEGKRIRRVRVTRLQPSAEPA
ncbi:MAG TPA: hemolysin family protein [Candidatus Limnocylindria bacterium]|jgi:CBS domain containing-hemolysin-like protein|nr:hemolysin family protein [Candidatus Limnocylindria bacterium]